MVSPPPCTVVTELMPTWTTLWRQRMRWQRGAVENIGAYGLTPATARYWGQQVAIGYGTIAIYAFMLLMLITILAVDQWVWFPFWLGIGAIFVLERIVTVWRGGWRARLLAAVPVPGARVRHVPQRRLREGPVRHHLRTGRALGSRPARHAHPMVAEAE